MKCTSTSSTLRVEWMSGPRFFVPDALSPDNQREMALPDAAAHHAIRVVRLAAGDPLTLFDGTGGEYPATLVRAGREGAVVRIGARLDVERESPLAITLAQAIAANDAMDYAIRKAVELGAAAIQPLVTERSAPLPAGERGDKRLAHWRGVVVAACEQCGRNRVPPVSPPIAFGSLLAVWKGSGLVLVPEAATPFASLPPPAAPIALVVGPEGGLSERESGAARAAGFRCVSLGPRVLRTETAAVAALAAMQALWGDLR
jgi:16S rRNA (uracil1498-N3)-methyltransferase